MSRAEDVERVLGRPERHMPLGLPLARLAHERVLVTGAAGSLGVAVVGVLDSADIDYLATDVDELDVRDGTRAARYGADRTLILHLAGAKHAPEGELDPFGVLNTNALGTRNLLEAAGARVVLASTCKAADPETAYGASKLLAERMVLNAGGSIARFYNVVESAGNVFELWRSLPEDAPLPVCDGCSRYFISLQEALTLLVWAAVLPPARYTIDPGPARSMASVASTLYPGRAVDPISARRGDRLTEPRHAASETLEKLEHGLERIHSQHDPSTNQRSEHMAVFDGGSR